MQDITEHMLRGGPQQDVAAETAALRDAQRISELNYLAGLSIAQMSNRPGMPAVPPPLENPYAVPNINLIQRPTRTLYVVAFKCARADIYYIPANTGLQVKKGDMVIVEGDRGIDLGTVSHAGVGMEEAKILKEKANEEHYRWLMMFSRHAAAVRNNLVSSSPEQTTSPASAVGGMGPPLALVPPGQVQAESADFRPKMIKRLAQAHEIQMLRDKEGSEAKAKRVCQGKVSEHGLVMEILDAEFQLDWKKLTFFYYAESYINFNDLVTDLFKIYKTRIWMSAINPASFAAPSISHGLTPTSPTGNVPSSIASPHRETSFRFSGAPSQDQPSAFSVPQMVSSSYFSPGQFPSQWGNLGANYQAPGRGMAWNGMSTHSPHHYPVMPPVSPMLSNVPSQYAVRNGVGNGIDRDGAKQRISQDETDAMFQAFPSLALTHHRPA